MEGRFLTEFHWHKWFAWRPVKVPGPRPETIAIVWLEACERRQVIEGRKVSWEYRAIWNSSATR